MSVTLDAALHYADKLHWAVFPAPPGEKKSHLSAKYSDGRPWGATNEPAEVRRNFEQFTGANIGISTGETSGIFVVEADTLDGHSVDGIASLAALEEKHGPLPATLEAESPSGSRHYYFRHPGFPVKTSAGVIAPGVDVRGDGGMVLAPPSVKPGKGVYKWRDASIPIANAPQWLLTMVKAAPKQEKTVGVAREAPVGLRPTAGTRAARALESACDTVRNADEGTRNDTLNRQAYFVGRLVGAGEIGMDVAYQALAAACEGWDNESKTLGTIKSGLSSGVKVPAGAMFANVPGVMTATAGNAMTGAGTQAIIDVGLPLVAQFNAVHANIAHDAEADALLPIDMHAAELRGPLTESVGKILTLAKTQRAALSFDTIADVLGVLHRAHQMSYDAVVGKVRATGAILAEGRLKKAVENFEADVESTLRTGQGWIIKHGGAPDPDVSDNIAVYFDRVNLQLRFNLFTLEEECSKDGTPWRPMTAYDEAKLSHDARTTAHRFNVKKQHLKEGITTIARQRCYDPLIDYLDSLQWNGTARLDTWLSRACGVPADEYHVAVARNVIGGLVKRARMPGAKHDEVLLLISPRQGTSKSGLAKALMHDAKWFKDGLDLSQTPQNLVPDLAGKWLIEWSELASVARKDIEEIKEFISRATDRYTAKWETRAVDHGRRFLMIATTNILKPLRDESGNRRFLPVHVRGEINLDWVNDNRDQIFAEADALYANGERFGIPRELWDTAGEHQEAARRTSLAEDLIAEWFEGRQKQFYVTATDLTMALQRRGVPTNASIESACSRVGLSRERTTVAGERFRIWITTGADPDTTSRVKLSELKMGEDRSKVTWIWPITTSAPPPRAVPPPPY